MKIKKTISLIITFFIIYTYMPLPVIASKKSNKANQSVIEIVNIKWWQDFNDTILLDYILKAIQYNNDIKISTLKTEEIKEQKNLIRANEMPSLGIGTIPALYKIPTQTVSHDFISLPIYANYELDLFGKNRDKTKSMDKIYEISKYNEKSAYISVVSAVGSTYYNIVKLDKLIELQQEIIKDRKQIYDLMKLSNEEGLVSTADTVNANKAYIKSQSDMLELNKSRERMLNILAVLTGESPENTVDFKRIAFEELQIKKQIPDCISSEIIESRPDYLTAEKMLEKAGLDIRIAKKEFLPDIDIFGLISFNSSDFIIKKMNWSNSAAFIGGSALLPLFTGGAKIANLKLKKNKYEQAIENYKKTNLISIQEVNDALCDLKSDNEKYKKTLENYNMEQKDFYYTELKYKEGIISNLDRLQKKEALLTTYKMVVNDKTDYFINQIGLYKAVAGADI